MRHLKSDIVSENVDFNIASFLKDAAHRFENNFVFQHKVNGQYEGVKWKELYHKILLAAHYLKNNGFKRGDKMVIYTPNCLEMLVTELAVMACGGVAVPIFAYFKRDTANMLIEFCDPKFLIIHGEFQYNQLNTNLNVEKIFSINEDICKKDSKVIPFSDLFNYNITPNEQQVLDFSIPNTEVCLNMYTSGTMGLPKCVQLTHLNILSQQVALKKIWNVNTTDRFLSYLPWHHSFGGIFELFSALYNGACYYLESGYGKDINGILENWKLVQPTIFFSVPKIYQTLIEQIQIDPSIEKVFFHQNLKFIFTAAAPLPENIANEFTKRDVKILEGWGLTETSPCCTIGSSDNIRQPGVVGFPIPGIEIRIDDEGEIQVKGPNVMKGYYKNDEANNSVFTEDGWFKTGDVGEITSSGLKLIARKDRIFKLSNGEKVIPTDIEKLIEKKCCYIAHSIVYGGGKEYPVAILFPNKKFFSHPGYDQTPEQGCFCPRNIEELGKCLRGCLSQANGDIQQKFSKIKIAAILDKELSIDDNTLTPSLKPSPKNIINKYIDHIKNLYGENVPLEEDIYVILLDDQLKNTTCYGRN